MIEWNSLVIACLAAFAIHYLYLQYLDATKDVPELYLNEQSQVDAVREEGESAIHKSNKLELQGGLRVGLDIRYDFYKIRSGNLLDVWEVLIDHVRKRDSTKAININGIQLPILRVNHAVQNLSEHFKSNNIESIKLPIEMVTSLTFDSLIVLFTGFINQINVEVYDSLDLVDTSKKSVFVCTDREGEGFFNIHSQTVYDYTLPENTLDLYENVYSFHKDRGIALTVLRKLTVKVLATVEFTQLNLISAIASTLKHLPPIQELSSKDNIVIVQSPKASNESIFNNLVKLLATFISHSDVTLVDDEKITDLTQLVETYNPTVLSIGEAKWSQIAANVNMNIFQKLLFDQCSHSLVRGKFPGFRFFSSRLRLIYINKLILALNNSLSQEKLNFWRCYLNTRIIVEAGYYNIVGPVVLTDFFDYRLLHVKGLKSFGCIAQSLEIKLTKVVDNRGELMVRGYTIGKTTTKLLAESEAENNRDIMKKTDGFMPLTNVFGRFGNDGCVYIV